MQNSPKAPPPKLRRSAQTVSVISPYLTCLNQICVEYHKLRSIATPSCPGVYPFSCVCGVCGAVCVAPCRRRMECLCLASTAVTSLRSCARLLRNLRGFPPKASLSSAHPAQDLAPGRAAVPSVGSRVPRDRCAQPLRSRGTRDPTGASKVRSGRRCDGARRSERQTAGRGRRRRDGCGRDGRYSDRALRAIHGGWMTRLTPDARTGAERAAQAGHAEAQR